MNQSGNYIWMSTEHQRRHAELLREAAMNRLAVEAIRKNRPDNRSTSKILTLIGKKLTKIGSALEKRFGITAENGTTMNQYSEAGECS